MCAPPRHRTWRPARLPPIPAFLPTPAPLPISHRRGFSASVINRFCDEIGVTKAAMTAKWELLEYVARSALDAAAPRRSAVLDPMQVRQPAPLACQLCIRSIPNGNSHAGFRISQ